MLVKSIFVFRDANGAFANFVSGDSSNKDAQAMGLRFELILTEPVIGRSFID